MLSDDFTQGRAGSRWLVFVFAVAALLSTAAPAAGLPDVSPSARDSGAEDDGNPRVETRLIADHSEVAPGQKFRIGVLFSLDPGWHIYWKNSGQAGLPPEFSWQSSGVELGPIHWPVPTPYIESGGEVLTFGYDDRVLLWTEARVPSDGVQGEKVRISTELNYLTCKVDCIPGTGQMSLNLPIGQTAPRDSTDKLFDTYSQRQPVPPEKAGMLVDIALSQRPIRPGDTFKAAIAVNYCHKQSPGCEDHSLVRSPERGAFMPEATETIDWRVDQIRAHPYTDHGFILELEGKASPDKPPTDQTLSGIFRLRKSGKKVLTGIRIETEIPRAKKGASISKVASPYFEKKAPKGGSQRSGQNSLENQTANASTGVSGQDAPTAVRSDESNPSPDVPFAYAVVLAFLGGMLLNLMPCVFPVLALKITAFTKLVHESRRDIWTHSLAYAGGITGSMIALASVVAALKFAGVGVGWGFQFQQPMYIVALSAVLVVFALNLFDVFQISVGADELAERTEHATGLRRSFLEGVLAVVLATPCSAPFLGTAVGFALTGSVFKIFAVFLVVGFGLAAPFVALVAVPGWRHLLPKPGGWMGVVKEVLGFVLLGTAVWLLWILGRTTGAAGVIWTLVFLLIVAAETWLYGRIQYRVTKSRRFAVLAVLAGIAVASAWYVPDFSARSSGSDSAVQSSRQSKSIDWQSWTEKAVREQVTAGRPVFVDFTADWCITCKVNENTVIDTKPIREAIDKHNVAMFKADWTEPDERIRKKLAEFGKAGVPMYLYYPAGKPNDPVVLSEQLTTEALLDVFSESSDDGAGGQ